VAQLGRVDAEVWGRQVRSGAHLVAFSAEQMLRGSNRQSQLL